MIIRVFEIHDLLIFCSRAMRLMSSCHCLDPTWSTYPELEPLPASTPSRTSNTQRGRTGYMMQFTEVFTCKFYSLPSSKCQNIDNLARESTNVERKELYEIEFISPVFVIVL